MSAEANMADGPEEKGTFQQLLEKNEFRWEALLPRNIPKERFRAAAIAAVRQNPDLQACTQRSLFNALTKAAQDGLLPDGREAIITSYNTKHKVIENGREVDRYLPTATYNPMTYGLRKRARELDGIIIDAQVVNKNDLFKRHQGDDPKIIHEPAELDIDPGPLVGCYAIFKREDGTILHREVMRAKEVTTTRDQSKAPDSLMWTKFETEGWKKTVIRRGIKTVPVSEGLERAITREDENFDFDQRREPERALAPPPAPPPAPKAAPSALENKPGVTLDASVKKEPEKVLAETRADTVYDQRTPAPRTQTEPEPHDPETGEVGPRALPVPVEGGKERFAPWGKSLIEAIMASKSHTEVDAWREANKFILERCEQTAPKAYASVQKAINQRANELMEGQKESNQSDPELGAEDAYRDWLADARKELVECLNAAAVEELRERILNELKPGDMQAWKDDCADKATAVFGGKRR